MNLRHPSWDVDYAPGYIHLELKKSWSHYHIGAIWNEKDHIKTKAGKRKEGFGGLIPGDFNI